jgi:hypothetical protein
VRVAHALEQLPLISGAFEKGAVSYSKVRAMTRVATPENEEYLLYIAEHGTAHHVERLVRHYRRVQRLDEVNAQHEARCLSYHYDEDGSLVIQGRLPPELGALFVKGIEAAAQAVREQEIAAGAAPTRPNFGARRTDALALMAETFIAKGPGELAGGERYQVVVHVAAETPEEIATGVAPTTELEDGPNVSAATSVRS